MRERLRLLLTGAVVSAAAIVLAVWVNAPAVVTPESRSAPSTGSEAAPDADTEFVSPVKDGVWPSAVISEDMHNALQRRAETEANAAKASTPAAGADTGMESPPREIGEFMDPEATLATSTTGQPRSIGEFLDPDADPAGHGAGEQTSVGQFLDPDEPSTTAAGTNRPVSIGRHIDPDNGATRPPAAEGNSVEIGEYIEVDD